ncbi:type III secretion system protein [Pseudomonas brassicacearum]|uniref:FliM/FliN family flagellar motor switch protein n=1 Tax=Pseudomonas brassicacearum TaxID=930166 RepID=UPI00042F2EE2|nr:FliM/FliN family flagellar motor switch protein [Pseudomonas brassicacearum]AHL34295.1 type III secretion system protein [Pseudomonas brassicacearum]
MSNEPQDEEPLYEFDNNDELTTQEANDDQQERLDSAQPDDTLPQDAATQPPSPLSGVTLALTVRCGEVKLSLEALGRLAAGSVVDVTGMAPGAATLCHEERVVAYGELVDVDGRLGMQITRLVFDQ